MFNNAVIITHLVIKSKLNPFFLEPYPEMLQLNRLKGFFKRKKTFNWERYWRQRNFVVTLIRKAKKDYNDKINLSLADPTISARKW